MHRALDLAKMGWSLVAPNPMVGCVIVKDAKIVAEGYHQKYGEAHAEVIAISQLPEDVFPFECTLYVTLEPCSHHGKTPPCADLIIEKGFNKVVICNLDPNPLVAGKGIEKLKNAGIEVSTGILKKEGFELNKRFFTFHQKHRPYYILKWAETADGFISKTPVPANRSENMIGDESQQIKVHQMRSEEMAIMIGKNTALLDNPKLTTRLVEGKNPIRILVDRNLEVPQDFQIYNNEAKTIIFNSIKDETINNISCIKLDYNKNILTQVSEKLYGLNIQSVLVEGGAYLLNDFIEQKMYDEVSVFVNENLHFGTGIKAPKII